MITGQQPAAVDQATLAEIVTFVWQTLVGDEIEQGAPATVGAGLSASISICGPWTATIVVAMGEELASRYAADLLGIDAGELTGEDVADAVGELVNVVGGNVKGLLDDDGASTLSLPIVTETAPTVAGGQLTVSAGFDVGGLPMSWEIHERP